jgi:hypothetical protein
MFKSCKENLRILRTVLCVTDGIKPCLREDIVSENSLLECVLILPLLLIVNADGKIPRSAEIVFPTPGRT